MRKTAFIYIYLSIACLIAASCSNTKYLAPNQYLFTGATIKVRDTANVSASQRSAIKSDLKPLLRPKPNSKILGLRIKLWFYNIAGTPKGKGLRYLLKNNLGEAPVLYSPTAIEKNRSVFQSRLENRGYFKDSVVVDTQSRSKKLTATYTVMVGEQYRISKVTYPADTSNGMVAKDTSSINKQIQRISRRSFLKKDDPYDLDMIRQERDRIDRNLKQHGYYYFNSDYLVMQVDSTVGNHRVDIDVRIKNQVPQKAREVYHINDIIVYADYDIRSDTNRTGRNVEHSKGLTIVDPKKKFKPKIFNQTLVFKPGDIYNRRDHDLSLNRLITMGVYKFVKVRFEDTDTSAPNSLNAIYYLTPTEKKSIRFEVSGLTKSNSSKGGELSLSFRNRNALRGAELFTVSVFGGLEKQIVGVGTNVTTTRLGTEISLNVPNIIGPSFLANKSGYVPKTRFATGFEYYNRSSQYVLTTVNAEVGYVWKENIRQEHQLNLVSLAYVNPTSITDAYRRQLDSNITLARSIQQQFIIGSTYNYNYNTQNQANRRKHNYYFNGNVDLSGNIAGLIAGANINKGKRLLISGVPVSQYIRGEADLRHYLRVGKTDMLATRLLAGVGYAYGNSNTLPFVKQFFAGGTNDIRAFSSRSLGPGTYYKGNPRVVGFIPEQPGDVKLEANVEYRAKLFSVVQGAVFVDAGNIWTTREDSSRPGAKFTSQFLNQFAVGTGLGLRLDFSVVLLRFDVAFPIRKPYITGGSKWVFDQINFGSPGWRRENLVYNLAIGYPF